MNVVESKNQPSFQFRGGSEEDGLKTNHQQARLRTSLMNELCSDPNWDPPVELCFRAKTNRTLKVLRLPESVRISLNYSTSGSYDYECFMRYLNRWIPQWTPERAAAHDWRLYFLDDFRVHNMKVVTQFFWDSVGDAYFCNSP